MTPDPGEVDRAVRDLWQFAAGRGMSREQWRGAAVALGFLEGTKGLSLDEYVLLKDEVFSLLGVTDEE